ncbi:MAG TPA: VWA domain-containing protein [Bryobacteraceae bacterium]|nr:VWA domain-containing protein [Bryobacteraceae bacterium]
MRLSSQARLRATGLSTTAALRCSAIAIAIFAHGCLSCPARAQAVPAAQESPQTPFLSEAPPLIRFDVNLTVLHATVMDRSGRIVPGLGQRDFQLFVDGTPKPITMFQPEDAPVAAGIVVDNSASMINKGSEVIAAALAFARASNPQDEMFVVHFNGDVRLGLPPEKPFTDKIPELERALARFSPEGTTALYDAVSLAIQHCQKSKLERKVLLVVSDGGDNSSREGLEDLIKVARASGIQIYCIGIYDETDRDRNPRVLTQIAEATGANAHFPSELKDVTGACLKIARDIRQQYTLGFAGNRDGHYHTIKVVAQRSGSPPLEVRTRAAYFAPAP